ncbi:MAG: alpha/beta hydrolase [Candidatus Izemoplasmatales bacterium]
MKILKKILLSIVILIAVLFAALFIYSSNPYQPLEAMTAQIETLNTDSITIEEKSNSITYTVPNPSANILFIPGGLVNPHSYDYLNIQLALAGYNVTVYKPPFDLAILSPNAASRFLKDDMDNIIIGHSLGGVVASMIASKSDLISKVILLGSYPIKDITDKQVLILTAEFDLGMDQTKFDESLQYVNDNAIVFDIIGGNHAQFGWYGPQKGDGEADITTLDQQDIVIAKIIDFIQT